MQVAELPLALYDAFAPTDAKEKARVRAEIMTEWNSLVVDPTSSNYKKGDFWSKIKTTIKENTNGGWTSMFTGLLYPVLFRWVTQLINPSDPDEYETGVRPLRP